MLQQAECDSQGLRMLQRFVEAKRVAQLVNVSAVLSVITWYRLWGHLFLAGCCWCHRCCGEVEKFDRAGLQCTSPWSWWPWWHDDHV